MFNAVARFVVIDLMQGAVAQATRQVFAKTTDPPAHVASKPGTMQLARTGDGVRRAADFHHRRRQRRYSEYRIESR